VRRTAYALAVGAIKQEQAELILLTTPAQFPRYVGMALGAGFMVVV